MCCVEVFELLERCCCFCSIDLVVYAGHAQAWKWLWERNKFSSSHWSKKSHVFSSCPMHVSLMSLGSCLVRRVTRLFRL